MSVSDFWRERPASLILAALFLFAAFPASVQAQLALASPNAEEYGQFGRAVAGVGDTNGDDVPDLLVGAPDETVDGKYSAGRVYLFSGADGSLLQAYASSNLEESGEFGQAAAGVGDTNGDDVPDLLVGARSETVDGKDVAGRAYLFSGADGSLLQAYASSSPEEDGFFGESVAGVGDANGDGAPDLLVGALETDDGTNSAGQAYLFSGADGSLLQAYASPNPEEDGFFGESVAGVGDASGDDVPDLLVGAPDETVDGTNSAGRVYLFSGADGSLIRAFTSPNVEVYGSFGEAVSEVGDADGDGASDLLIGATGEKQDLSRGRKDGAGRAYLLSGGDGSLLQAYASPNPEEDGRFGGAVAGIGDVDGDEVPDLLVGAEKEWIDEIDSKGRAYLFSGEDGSLIRPFTSPNAARGWFGEAMAGIGDADGDGAPDLLVGGHGEVVDGKDGAGRAYLFSGVDEN